MALISDAGEKTRTFMINNDHKILNLARLPIPPHPHDAKKHKK